jgi:hypothetical protein
MVTHFSFFPLKEEKRKKRRRKEKEEEEEEEGKQNYSELEISCLQQN